MMSVSPQVPHAAGEEGRKLLVSYINALIGALGKGNRLSSEKLAVVLTEVRWATDALTALSSGAEGFKGEERRLTKRFVTKEQVPLTVEGKRASAQLVDLSHAGARLLVDRPLQPGQRIGVELDGEELAAQVVWANDSACGASFINQMQHVDGISRYIIRHAL